MHQLLMKRIYDLKSADALLGNVESGANYELNAEMHVTVHISNTSFMHCTYANISYLFF